MLTSEQVVKVAGLCIEIEAATGNDAGTVAWAIVNVGTMTYDDFTAIRNSIIELKGQSNGDQESKCPGQNGSGSEGGKTGEKLLWEGKRLAYYQLEDGSVIERRRE